MKGFIALVIVCVSLLLASSCSKSRAMSCPSYWEGDKNKELRGTNMAKDENGNVVPKDAMPTKSPVKKNKKNGLIDKKKDKRMNANYYRK